MKLKKDLPFNIVNGAVLIFLAIICIVPFIHVISVSLSDNASVSAGRVSLLPIGLNFESYKLAFSSPNFLRTMGNSVYRLLIGVGVNTLLTIMAAYPLSKTDAILPGRTAVSWIFVITLLISGGIVPLYMVVHATNIDNSIWALILPYATPVFNVTILLNFFRGIPKELEESAEIDGAGVWTVLWRIFIPLSKPCLVTLVIYQAVFHWNEWFWGLVFIDNVEEYPLATFMRNVITSPDLANMTLAQIEELLRTNSRSFSAAQIIIGSLPILILYPILSRYFVQGMTLGGVKE